MAHLNMDNAEEFTHLIQLFLAKHPEHHALNEGARTAFDAPGEYFLSRPMVEALVRWGRSTHLLTRRQGDVLLFTARQSLATPDEAVRLIPCVLGTPPRLQQGVLSADIFAWIYCKPAPDAEGHVLFTLDAAARLCLGVADDPETSAPCDARARTLADWLAAQRAA